MTREQFDTLFPECRNAETMTVPIAYFHARMQGMTDAELDIAFPAWRSVTGKIQQLPVQAESEAS